MTQASSTIDRIDTHHHFMPAFYTEWLNSWGVSAAGGRRLPAWTPQTAVEFMDRIRAKAAVVSISTPGVHLGDDQEACAMARRLNEHAAEVVARCPQRMGYFAVLPLPDVTGAIREAEYALDELGADGVLMLANANGVYLGDPAWEPLMAVLNKRRAVVFVHPSTLAGPSLENVPPFVADFLLDTTRAAIQYAQSGALERYPELRVILSHGGGFLPYAAERVARICSPDGKNPGGLARLRQFYFDTALTSSPYALPSLLAFAQPDHITFGSDWPFADAERSLHFADLLDRYELDHATRQSIHHGAAERLFPRFAAKG